MKNTAPQKNSIRHGTIKKMTGAKPAPIILPSPAKASCASLPLSIGGRPRKCFCPQVDSPHANSRSSPATIKKHVFVRRRVLTTRLPHVAWNADVLRNRVPITRRVSRNNMVLQPPYHLNRIFRCRSIFHRVELLHYAARHVIYLFGFITKTRSLI